MWRDFDYPLFILSLCLTAVGMVMIGSAAEGVLGVQGLALRHALYGLVGMALQVALGALDYRILAHLQRPIYVLVILMLLLVFLVGQVTHGVQRWIDLGLFPIQPSEIGKVLLILVFAGDLSRHEEALTKLRYVLLSLAYVALPILLIYLQPNLGTALALGAIWLTIIFVAGMRVRYLFLLGLAGLLSVPFLWHRLEGYMRTRLLTFLNPALDPAKQYNVDQALISIGSGGWLGKGLASGSQSQLHFLRVRHTDFVFSVVGEELGFVGAVLVIVLLALLVLRLLHIAEQSRDTFGRLVVCGVAAMIAFQALVNIGMNVGLLPVAGIPLPFISYGGSSLLSIFIALGLAQSVALRHRKIDFELYAPTAQIELHSRSS